MSERLSAEELERAILWLLAQIAEDAERADRLAKRYVYPPDHELAGQSYWPRPTVRGALRRTGDDDAAALIGAFSPARVLAEVQAKRERITMVAAILVGVIDTATGRTVQISSAEERVLAEAVLATELEPYKERPGYGQGWRYVRAEGAPGE